jgi:nucleotide-binding universal stress UspA family protein
LIKFCKKRQAKLVVFHAAQFIYGAPDEGVPPEIIRYKKKIDGFKSSIEQQCKKAGVRCDVKISTDFALVSDLALKEAKRVKADLIAVVAKSGRLTALMGGSMTRQILRETSLPVLVMRE